MAEAVRLCIIADMLKIVSIVIVIGVVGIVLFAAYMRETNPLSVYETKTLQVGNAKLDVFVADTREKRTKGLMGVADLGPDAGMLFMFPNASPRTFWNKNTLIPLDLIWISSGRVIGVSSLPSIAESGNKIISLSSPSAADWVLEVNAGWVSAHGIEVGGRVE